MLGGHAEETSHASIVPRAPLVAGTRGGGHVIRRQGSVNQSANRVGGLVRLRQRTAAQFCRSSAVAGLEGPLERLADHPRDAFSLLANEFLGVRHARPTPRAFGHAASWN